MKKQKGMVLIGVIVLMLVAGLFLASTASLVFSSGGSHNNVVQGTQALAIAQAGAEWYMETLRTDTDWTDESGTSMSYGGGRFDISVYANPTATEVHFSSIGTFPSLSANPSALTGQRFTRFEEWTVQKLPSVFKLAVFNASIDNGDFEIKEGSIITGSVWSSQDVKIKDSDVNEGKVYVPDEKDVTGNGTYTKKLMPSPDLVRPDIDATTYQDQMNDYDTLLNNNPSNDTPTITSGNFNVSGEMNYRTITFNGNVTITGGGTIIAEAIRINSGGGTSTVTINPDAGKTIVFLANRTFEIGSTSGTTVTNTRSCTFYSASAGAGSPPRIYIRGSNVSLKDSVFMARRGIAVSGGAKITGNSFFFVDDFGKPSNAIEITGSSSHTRVQANMISMSPRDPSIRIMNSSNNLDDLEVEGMVFTGDAAKTGVCEIENARISGSVVCNKFKGSKIKKSEISYKAISSVPAGFEGYISRKNNSWDGY